MLTKPKAGWTDFSLPGTGVYGLSYLDDIPFEWIEQAIHGLETMLPFCVKGFLEPRRMVCVVSYWNCYVTVEDDERQLLKEGDFTHAYSHTSMLEFCRALYEDINADVDGWADFVDYQNEDREEKKRRLREKLVRLREWINEREEWFGENRCFL